MGIENRFPWVRPTEMLVGLPVELVAERIPELVLIRELKKTLAIDMLSGYGIGAHRGFLVARGRYEVALVLHHGRNEIDPEAHLLIPT